MEEKEKVMSWKNEVNNSDFCKRYGLQVVHKRESYFWKGFAIFCIIIIMAGFILLFQNGGLEGLISFNQTTENTHEINLNPEINTPVDARTDNTFENKFYLNIDKELIERFCNGTG